MSVLWRGVVERRVGRASTGAGGTAGDGEERIAGRASGGLVGVAAAEVLASRPRRFGPVRPAGPLGPVGAALLDVGFGYLAQRGVAAPVDVVHGHPGAGGTGWLLAVVVARSGVSELVGDTVDLAEALELSRRDVCTCVSYAEVAACLLAGWSVAEAVGTSPVVTNWVRGPQLCGDGMTDSLEAGVWALCQPAGLVAVVTALAGLASPAVVAAAAGLVGLRDGAAATPGGWSAWHGAASCRALAPALARLRVPVGAGR